MKLLQPRSGERFDNYNSTRLNRSEFAITDTELKLIAAAAKIGLNKIPNHG